MSSLKRIVEQDYITNLFRNLALQKSIPINLTIKNKKFKAKLFFTTRKGCDPCIIFEDDGITLKAGEKLKITFFDRELGYSFRTAALNDNIGNTLDIEKPQLVYTSYRRLVPRYKFSEDEDADIYFEDNGVKGKISDISIMGLSFLSNDRFLSLEATIINARIFIDKDLQLYINAKVRYMKQNNQFLFQYGIEFENLEYSASDKLLQFINKKIRPNLKSFKDTSRFDIESVIDESTMNKDFHQSIKPESLCSNLVEMKNENLIFSGFSYNNNGKCLAFGTTLWIYDKTFLGQLFYYSQEVRFDSLPWTEIYSGLADLLLLNPHFENYILNISKKNNWQVEIMSDIEKIINDQNKFYLDFQGYYICDTLKLLNGNSQTELSCESLQYFDSFFEYCKRHLNPLTIAIYGYDDNCFSLDETKRRYESLGYFKERSLFCVKKHNEIIAFAVVESSSDVFNFNLLDDHCKLYLTNNEQDIDQILQILLPKLANYFAEISKKSFRLLICQSDEFANYCPVDGVDFENQVVRIMMNRKGLAEYKKLLVPSFIDYNKYYPLTYPQMAIWQTEKFFPGTSFGNIVGNANIKDHLDSILLEKAVNLAVQKNDGFRIRILEDGEKVRQYIAKYRYFKVDFFDFSIVGDYAAFMRWNENKTTKPFTLNDSELFYFAIFKINEFESGLFINIHHLIGDAWSSVSQTSKIIEDYYKLINGIHLDQENNPSYIDFIRSEEDYLYSEKYESHKKFWSEKYKTVPEFTSFKPVGEVYRNIKASRKTVLLPKEITAQIQCFCDQFKFSPMTVFLSLLYIYIYKITSKSDIVIGAPVLNRANMREKNMVGMFISVVPIRFQVDGNLDFLALLNNLTKEFNTLLRNQRYPYDLIQTEFRKRHSSGENLFDTMMSFQNAKIEKTELTGDYSLLWQFNGYQTDSLQIHVSDRGDDGEYALNFDYLMDMYSENDILRMSDQFINILIDAIQNPYNEINDLAMISNEEKIKLLQKFNSTGRDFPQNMTIHELFEYQVNITPENAAVVFAGEILTYKELNQRANSLANALRDKNISPDEIIGIMLERSLEMIIGILGILKSGGAYLPLDSSYPDDRLNYMIKDSGCKFILVHKTFNQKITFDGEFVFIDDETLYNKKISNLKNVCTSRNLAYVIYTSGSTGEPKGVMLEHRGVVNLKTFFEKDMQVTPNDRIIQFASCSFDAFVWETFMALFTGASLYMISKSDIENYIKFEKFLNKNKISIATLPPSYLVNLNPENVNTLQKLISAGSSITCSLMKKWCHNVLYINAYGPTETTICATIWKCSQPDSEIDFVPIGTPITNTKILILNKLSQLQPIGVPGEICISGVSLARGYLNKNDLTAEKFISSPYMDGKKLYRTGDLAKWLPDGNIEFLGRIDNQIKIRGFRIELGEIENLLLNHSSVTDAFVMERKDESGNSYLCAYIVLDDINFKIEDLKNYLTKKLPSFMVPAFIVPMDSLPISSNGKIDKKVLPEPMKKTSNEPIYDFPMNDIEKTLLEFWKDALEIKNIGLNENIFDLGADSLAIMKVLTKSFIFDWDVTMQDFYEYQTIRKLSNKILGKPISYNFENDASTVASTSLDALKPFCNAVGRREMKNILLTGTTGFLGIHLLSSILENTIANVYCLVRGKNVSSAEHKLIEKLDFYFENKFGDLLNQRIFVLNGDVSSDRMGLSLQEYESLAAKIDTSFHAAAIVKHFGDYTTFEKVNIFGTQNIIDFCILSGAKLHHISTISVAGDYSEQNKENIKFTENNFYIGQDLGENVYLKSKFEAEKIVIESSKNGLDASIYRVGNLTGRYSDGLFQPNMQDNKFYNILRFFTNLKMISTDIMELEIELTPVDVCAKSIIELANLYDGDSKVFHLCNAKKIKLGEIIDAFNAMGSKIIVASPNHYKERIEQVANNNDLKEMLLGVVNVLDRNGMFKTENSIEVSCEITEKILKRIGIRWPDITCEYLMKLYKCMLDVGFVS